MIRLADHTMFCAGHRRRPSRKPTRRKLTWTTPICAKWRMKPSHCLPHSLGHKWTSIEAVSCNMQSISRDMNPHWNLHWISNGICIIIYYYYFFFQIIRPSLKFLCYLRCYILHKFIQMFNFPVFVCCLSLFKKNIISEEVKKKQYAL